MKNKKHGNKKCSPVQAPPYYRKKQCIKKAQKDRQENIEMKWIEDNFSSTLF